MKSIFFLLSVFVFISCAHRSTRVYNSEVKEYLPPGGKRFVYLKINFRSNQKEPKNRAVLIEEAFDQFFLKSNHKASKYIGLLEDEKDLKPGDLVFEVQEYGPHIYLELIPPGWYNSTDILLTVWNKDQTKLNKFNIYDVVGGTYFLRGEGRMKKQMLSLLEHLDKHGVLTLH